MRFCRLLSVIACTLFTVQTAIAQVPQLINYQGRVAVSGTNFTGSGQFKFALVSGSAPNVTYWSNDGTSTAGSAPANAVSLTVANGLYDVLLGDTTVANMTEIPATVFTNPDVRLRVWLNDGVHDWQQLTPDERIAAVGYALVAKTASYNDLTNKPTLGSAAALNTGTGAGTVAAGNDSRFSSVNAATQTALDGKATAAQGEKAETALQPTSSGSGLSDVTPKYQALPNLSVKLSAKGTRQFRIGGCGDSFMSNANLADPLYRLLGIAGYHMTNTTVAGSATTSGNDFTSWITGCSTTLVAPGDTAMFTNHSYAPFVMNTVHYYVITTPTSGTVKLQYSLNGTGAWTDMTPEISCVSSETASMVLSGSLPARASYLTRIVSVSGSTKVVGALGYDSSATGVIFEEFARGGIVEKQFGATVPSSILTPILTDLAPDTIVWKSAVSPAVMQANTEKFFALFNNIKAADWVVVTPHPVTDAVMDAGFVQNIAYLRSVADSHHYFLFDCYSLFGSAADLIAKFGDGGAPHLSAAADKYWVSSLIGTGIFNNGGSFVATSSLSGQISYDNIEAFRDVSSLSNWEVGIKSSGETNFTFQPNPSRVAGIYFKGSSGEIQSCILKHAATTPYFSNSIEFMGRQSPYRKFMFNETGNVWIGTSYPTATPTDALHVADGASYFGGTVTLAGTLALTGTSSAPLNTTTPIAWRDVVINGVTYKVPLYQ